MHAPTRGAWDAPPTPGAGPQGPPGRRRAKGGSGSASTRREGGPSAGGREWHGSLPSIGYRSYRVYNYYTCDARSRPSQLMKSNWE